jgi:hypothetical protein
MRGGRATAWRFAASPHGRRGVSMKGWPIENGEMAIKGGCLTILQCFLECLQ